MTKKFLHVWEPAFSLQGSKSVNRDKGKRKQLKKYLDDNLFAFILNQSFVHTFENKY